MDETKSLTKFFSLKKLPVSMDAPEFLYFVIVFMCGFQIIEVLLKEYGTPPEQTVHNGLATYWRRELLSFCHSIFCSSVALYAVATDREMIYQPTIKFTALTYNLLVVAYGYYAYSLAADLRSDPISWRSLLHDVMTILWLHYALVDPRLVGMLTVGMLMHIAGVVRHLKRMMLSAGVTHSHPLAYRIVQHLDSVLLLWRFVVNMWIFHHTISLDKSLKQYKLIGCISSTLLLTIQFAFLRYDDVGKVETFSSTTSVRKVRFAPQMT